MLAISGTIVGSKPLALVRKVVQEINTHFPEVRTSILDLKKYDIQFCDGRSAENYNSDTRQVLRKVEEADFYLIGTPIFQASIPGTLKNLFDLIPPKTFRNKVMGFVGVGGTYQHFLVIENQLKPIASYFRSYIAPSYVYANNEHFNEHNEVIDKEIVERISILAQELVFMHKSLSASDKGVLTI